MAMTPPTFTTTITAAELATLADEYEHLNGSLGTADLKTGFLLTKDHVRPDGFHISNAVSANTDFRYNVQTPSASVDPDIAINQTFFIGGGVCAVDLPEGDYTCIVNYAIPNDASPFADLEYELVYRIDAATTWTLALGVGNTINSRNGNLFVPLGNSSSPRKVEFAVRLKPTAAMQFTISSPRMDVSAFMV